MSHFLPTACIPLAFILGPWREFSIWRGCCQIGSQQTTKWQFCEALLTTCCDHPTLDRIYRILSGKPVPPNSKRVDSVLSRVIVPFHPLWSHARLSRAAAEVHRSFTHLLEGDPIFDKSKVGVAWRLADKHLFSRAAQHYHFVLT